MNQGNCTLAFATKPISEGEEITDTYCPTFASAPVGKRREALKKYNFECGCEACAERWPTLAHLPQKLTGNFCHDKLSAAEVKTQVGLHCYSGATSVHMEPLRPAVTMHFVEFYYVD